MSDYGTCTCGKHWDCNGDHEPMSDVREAWENRYTIGGLSGVFLPSEQFATIDTYLNTIGSPERVALLEAVAHPERMTNAEWEAVVESLAAYDREHGVE